MRTALEQHQDLQVYLFTRFGHTIVGRISVVEERVVRLIAPDGRTETVVSIDDVSSVRLHDQGAEGAV